MKGKTGFLMKLGVVLILLAAASACGQTPAPAPAPQAPSSAAPAEPALPRVKFDEIQLPQGTLTITRQVTPSASNQILRLTVKLAEDSDARSRGLMGVPSLPSSAGMVFRYNRPVTNSFHMENTLIPLDIAFWGQDGKIVKIMQMTPCKASPCQRYNPEAAYVGAVEVKGGLLEQKGVRVGDIVTLT